MERIFEITDFTIEDETIEVEIKKGDQEKIVSVPRQRFEKWLKVDDRLNWEDNYSDYGGCHVQQLGTYSIDEYWELLSNSDIEKDLYDFIITKMSDARKIFDTTLNNILSINQNI